MRAAHRPDRDQDHRHHHRNRSAGPTASSARFSPIFPVRDLPAALAHYDALGFDDLGPRRRREYGFADRDGLGLHLAASAEHTRTHGGSAYSTYAMPMPCTRSGAGPASAVGPARSCRPRTNCARAPTSTLTAT